MENKEKKEPRFYSRYIMCSYCDFSPAVKEVTHKEKGTMFVCSLCHLTLLNRGMLLPVYDSQEK